MFDPSVFFPAGKAEGMLGVATDDEGSFDVDFSRPGVITRNGGLTNEYRIEYQHADRPNLREGSTMTIVDYRGNAAGTFRVRETPYCDAPGNASTGDYWFATLTKTA